MIDDCADCLIGGDYTKLLIDAPYNRNVKDNKIIRVYNLADAYNFLHA